MDEFHEFEGKSTEEALAKAQAHYDLPLGRLEVEVVSAGSSGLFGLMGKRARIRVRVLADSTQDDLAALAAVVGDGRQLKPLGQRPKAKPAAPPAKVEAPAAAMPTPAPSAPQPQPPLSQPEPAPPSSAEPAEEEVLHLEEDGLEGLETEEEPLAADEEDEEGDKPSPGAEAEMMDFARQVLVRLLQPLDPQALVSASLEEMGVLLEVDSKEAGTLIGRRGQNLEALQYLVTRIVSHKAGRPVRIQVDAGGYRSRRREALEELARKAAAKARSGGRPVAVGPLSSPERRVVHMTLKNEPGVTTASRGRGEMKKVIVSAR